MDGTAAESLTLYISFLSFMNISIGINGDMGKPNIHLEA